jgi:mannan endo-1,4-beta-mannosidase
VLLRSKLPQGSCAGELGGQASPTYRRRFARCLLLLVALGILAPLVTIDSSRFAGATAAAGTSSSASIVPLAQNAAATQRLPVATAPPVPGGEARRIGIVALPAPPDTPVAGGAEVTSLSPDSVSAGGGATVVITGSDLGSVTAVLFGSNASSDFSVVSPTRVTATAPTNSGSVTVSVETPAGASAAGPGSKLTYVPTGQLPITAAGQSLEVGGVAEKFVGVNAYQLATDWGTNSGCGGMATVTQLNSFFASLGPGSMVRFWAFQGDFATDVSTHQIDWAPLDRIFYLAAEYHVYLIPTITDQGGACDGEHWQDPAWYTGGYKDVYDTAADSDGSGLTPLSYWNYMQEIVSRYKNSPALGMWEPISEAEASTCAPAFQPTNCSGHQTCPDESASAADLTSFFDNVGGEIHSIDPTHLVEEGLLGGSQCGMTGSLYESVGESPGIDVLSVHDYYGTAPMGGDDVNGLAARFSQAAALDKPIITGEVGILGGNGPSCVTLAQRSSDMAAKMNAQFEEGSSAFLVWNWVTDPLGPCNYNTGPGDPLMNLLEGSVGATPGSG